MFLSFSLSVPTVAGGVEEKRDRKKTPSWAIIPTDPFPEERTEAKPKTGRPFGELTKCVTQRNAVVENAVVENAVLPTRRTNSLSVPCTGDAMGSRGALFALIACCVCRIGKFRDRLGWSLPILSQRTPRCPPFTLPASYRGSTDLFQMCVLVFLLVFRSSSRTRIELCESTCELRNRLSCRGSAGRFQIFLVSVLPQLLVAN